MGEAIQINNVSKLYRLGQINSGALRSDLSNWWNKVIKRSRDVVKRLNKGELIKILLKLDYIKAELDN